MIRIYSGGLFERANPMLVELFKTAYKELVVTAISESGCQCTLNNENCKVIAIFIHNALFFSIILRNGDQIKAYIDF